MRVAIVYDCLYPYTIGGGERWYRALAERLAERHQVTYLTRRQWPPGERVDAPRGVQVEVVSEGRELYTRSGRRRIAPPLRFGWGVFRHIARNRGRYEIVHTCGFPYFSVLGARAAERLGGPPIVTDWFEIWPLATWRSYLGPVAGDVGHAVQRLCVRSSRRAFAFSALTAARLRTAGLRSEPVELPGMYGGPYEPAALSSSREPLVVFVGRHISQKRAPVIPAAIARARRERPELRAVIFGDGPERGRVLEEIRRLGLEESVRAPGFAPWEEVDAHLRRAACLILPSRREGYGLAVVEASARGTPSIVTRAADNAATELVEDGVNGIVATGADPETLGRAIVDVLSRNDALVASTTAWFGKNAARLAIEASIPRVEAVYTEVAGAKDRAS